MYNNKKQHKKTHKKKNNNPSWGLYQPTHFRLFRVFLAFFNLIKQNSAE